MAYEVRKAPQSTDPRGWDWGGDGWGIGAQPPFNWLVRSEGAFDWASMLNDGMVLHHSIISQPNNRVYFWQVNTVLDTRVFRLQVRKLANNEPSQTVPTLRFYFFAQQFFGEQWYEGFTTANSPYPIQPFFLPILSPPPVFPPGNVIPLGLIEVIPVPWWTPETPGGD